MQHKYQEFDDYLFEIENYGTRFERFHEEFQHIDIPTKQRIIDWMQASWNCAREEKDEERTGN